MQIKRVSTQTSYTSHLGTLLFCISSLSPLILFLTHQLMSFPQSSNLFLLLNFLKEKKIKTKPNLLGTDSWFFVIPVSETSRRDMSRFYNFPLGYLPPINFFLRKMNNNNKNKSPPLWPYVNGLQQDPSEAIAVTGVPLSAVILATLRVTSVFILLLVALVSAELYLAGSQLQFNLQNPLVVCTQSCLKIDFSVCVLFQYLHLQEVPDTPGMLLILNLAFFFGGGRQSP